MNSPPVLSAGLKPVDPDLAEQAVPGHGFPSQDPDPAAQVALSPEEAERESKSVLVGGGLVAGLATGAAIGAAVAGPVGVAASPDNPQLLVQSAGTGKVAAHKAEALTRVKEK